MPRAMQFACRVRGRLHQHAVHNYDASATVDDGSCDLSYMCLNGTIYDEELMGAFRCAQAT